MSNMKENTDRAEYLAGSRDAAVYMQTYIREQAENFHEMAIETNPNKGWGENKEVHNAHDIAMMLSHYTDENFLNCRIPEDYASPQALNEALENFRIMLIRGKEQLEENVSRLKLDSPMTLSIVHKNLVSCLHAVDETLAQLADAKAKIPENVTTGSIGTTPTPMERIHEIANRFSNVVRRMSTRRKGKDALVINDEYDVQYLFQGLLEVTLPPT
ncbi:MAG: hypothetical protein L3J83_09370 [Proteobacteria bacterium]|nr:hypothetical protein [Pseudomonadota bacterium]